MIALMRASFSALSLRGKPSGMSGRALGPTHGLRFLAVQEGVGGRGLGQRDASGHERAVDEPDVAEQTAVLVIDRGIPAQRLIAGVELVAKDHELYFRTIALSEGQRLAVDRGHAISIAIAHASRPVPHRGAVSLGPALTRRQ